MKPSPFQSSTAPSDRLADESIARAAQSNFKDSSMTPPQPTKTETLAAEMRAAAEAATPGPWEKFSSSVCDWNDGSFTMEFISNSAHEREPDDLAHIALANPANVLTILAEIERLKHEEQESSEWLTMMREQLTMAQNERDSLSTRLAESEAREGALREALDRIEGQAVCVGMDGEDGNAIMLRNIAGISRAALEGK